MATRRTTVEAVLALAAIGIVVSALAALVATQTVTNTGNINVVASVALGVYSNSACTNVLSSIPWGTLNPGVLATQTIYVKNQGNVNVTLTMTTGNYTPASIISYLTVTWDRQNYVLTPSSSVPAVVSLSVSSNVSSSTSFSFDINITATQ
jgi:hypothetical protein